MMRGMEQIGALAKSDPEAAVRELRQLSDTVGMLPREGATG